MSLKIGVKVFDLPSEEIDLNNFINREDIDITNKVITPMPKQGNIIYLVEYEQLCD